MQHHEYRGRRATGSRGIACSYMRATRATSAIADLHRRARHARAPVDTVVVLLNGALESEIPVLLHGVDRARMSST